MQSHHRYWQLLFCIQTHNLISVIWQKPILMFYQAVRNTCILFPCDLLIEWRKELKINNISLIWILLLLYLCVRSYDDSRHLLNSWWALISFLFAMSLRCIIRTVFSYFVVSQMYTVHWSLTDYCFNIFLPLCLLQVNYNNVIFLVKMFWDSVVRLVWQIQNYLKC